MSMQIYRLTFTTEYLCAGHIARITCAVKVNLMSATDNEDISEGSLSHINVFA